jgi:NAD(P)-dependent dehydrogenase (short-subunit alcohol dehydrogenase family)
MMRRKWGVIIKISSTRAKVGDCHLTVCFAAKHGWVGLTWPLALEASRSAFTVNAISRSYIDDMRGVRICEGTSEIQKVIIERELLKKA